MRIESVVTSQIGSALGSRRHPVSNDVAAAFGAAPTVPVMDRRQFADLVGLTLDTVEGMIERGYLPVVRIGKRSLVNIALLNQRCLDKEFS